MPPFIKFLKKILKATFTDGLCISQLPLLRVMIWKSTEKFRVQNIIHAEISKNTAYAQRQRLYKMLSKKQKVGSRILIGNYFKETPEEKLWLRRLKREMFVVNRVW